MWFSSLRHYGYRLTTAISRLVARDHRRVIVALLIPTSGLPGVHCRRTGRISPLDGGPAPARAFLYLVLMDLQTLQVAPTE